MTLRAVAPGEKPAKKASTKTRVKSITEAADKGTLRELLVAMRTRIAKACDDANTPARDLAALTKRLSEVTKDIEAIDALVKQEGGEHGPVEDEAFDSSAV